MVLKLTRDQEDFLNHYSISMNEVLDASWLKTKEYKLLMRKLWKRVAIWVVPCSKWWHTIRCKHGHCLECAPACIGYTKNHYSPWYIYIAKSKGLDVIKVWLSQNIEDRKFHLNKDRYAWAADRDILFLAKCENKGKVENMIHKYLDAYKICIEYNNWGKIAISTETFKCNYSIAMQMVEKAKKDGVSFEDEWQKELLL